MRVTSLGTWFDLPGKGPGWDFWDSELRGGCKDTSVALAGGSAFLPQERVPDC